jgi:anion-transporting  ArsA/GET3 family ATPase
VLENYVSAGIFNRLTKSINQLKQQITKMTKDGSHLSQHADKILPVIESLYDRYHISTERLKKEENTNAPIIVTSETFE